MFLHWTINANKQPLILRVYNKQHIDLWAACSEVEKSVNIFLGAWQPVTVSCVNVWKRHLFMINRKKINMKLSKWWQRCHLSESDLSHGWVDLQELLMTFDLPHTDLAGELGGWGAMSLQREGTVHRLLVTIPHLGEGEFLQQRGMRTPGMKRKKEQRAESGKEPDPLKTWKHAC